MRQILVGRRRRIRPVVTTPRNARVNGSEDVHQERLLDPPYAQSWERVETNRSTSAAVL